MRAENCNKKNAISCRIKEAFTLLEMMVSIFIFSMILLSIYEIWTLILMGKQASTYAAAEVQRTRVGMRALSESLMAARIFQANTNYYSFEVDNEGDFTALSFVSYLPPGFIGSGLYDGLPLRRITYVVEGNDAAGIAAAPDGSDSPFCLRQQRRPVALFGIRVRGVYETPVRLRRPQ